MGNLFRPLLFKFVASLLAAGVAGAVFAQADSSDCFFANGTPGCDNAYCEAAVCDVDPFCCEVAWDSLCANAAPDICPGNCLTTDHGAGCSNSACQTTVCDLDPFCCEAAWDNFCVEEALDFCEFATYEDKGTDFCFTVVAKNGKVVVNCLGPDLLEPLDANPPGNQAPNVNAGPNQSITLPTDSVSFTPTVSDDGLPEPSMLTYAWAQTGGTTTGVNIVSPTSKNTDVTFTEADTYTFELTVDDGELDNSDSIQVTVADPAPDLIVDTVSVTNSTPDESEMFTINATVRNQGTGASESTTLLYYRSTNNIISTSDTQIGTDAVAGLAPGANSPESVPVSIASAGTYFVGACVNAVSNESPTNNQCSAGVQVTVKCGGEDLVGDEQCVVCNGLQMVNGDASPDPRSRTFNNCALPASPPASLNHGFANASTNCTTSGCHSQ